MDNFSYVAKHSSLIKNEHIAVEQTFTLFLFFANFLLFSKLGYLDRIIFADKGFKPLCYLMACAREGFAIYVFVDNS